MHLRGERRLRRTANVETWALKRLGNVQRPRPTITPASQVSGLMTFSTGEIHSRADNDNTRPQSDTVQQNVLSNKEKCHRGKCQRVTPEAPNKTAPSFSIMRWNVGKNPAWSDVVIRRIIGFGIVFEYDQHWPAGKMIIHYTWSRRTQSNTEG